MQIREIEFQELGLIKPLFRRVFNSDISEAMLAWKYGEGRGKSYGIFTAEGELLAHCGIFYRQALADGISCRIVQLGDLMALPGHHGGVSRLRSPFALLIQKVLADLPDALNPDALAFGFPSDRAMRLGEHLGLFSSIDQMWELHFNPISVAKRADRCVELDPASSGFTTSADRLWQLMADDLGKDLIGVRDAAYLQQRYFSHPHNRYCCHLVSSKWFGRPLGLLITRKEGEQCELLDIIAPFSNFSRLLQAARHQMTVWGSSTMNFWLTEHNMALFRHHAETVRQLEFRIMANPFSSAGHPERFTQRWWLTSGDTDYH